MFNNKGKIWAGVFVGLYVLVLGALILWGTISVENTFEERQMSIVVEFGSEMAMTGEDEPDASETTPPQTPPQTPTTNTVATQHQEPTHDLQENNMVTDEEAVFEEQTDVEEEPNQEQPTLIERALFKNNPQYVEDDIPPNDPNPDNPKIYDDTEEPEINLPGRSTIGKKPVPSYDKGEASGTVVVNIIVDNKGNVISAELGKDSTTFDQWLVDEAIRAAKKTSFTTSDKDFQHGTITYHFVRKVK